MAKFELPSWPRVMRRATAAAYLDMSIAEFERGVALGTLPMPVKIVSRERWSRTAIDAALERLEGGPPLDDWRARSPLYSGEPIPPKKRGVLR
ncbi:helix-turn-helix transcriptional regulator [Sphingosinicella rhizophila]|uniref:Uncharacterized protein n=1 Tax=Sphingosinicella rhizophila TaxID=3050082 RepID=A0ABU3Q5H7_9SPHN|nr:hypothetical protein [Sphingosinicella sp. GR2756]MDT9598547.1 hypothetical protein [Sphingosinicella sp. GR2756]